MVGGKHSLNGGHCAWGVTFLKWLRRSSCAGSGCLCPGVRGLLPNCWSPSGLGPFSRLLSVWYGGKPMSTLLWSQVAWLLLAWGWCVSRAPFQFVNSEEECKGSCLMSGGLDCSWAASKNLVFETKA